MPLKILKIYFFSISIVIFATMGNAACNFKTGEFIDELADPSNIIQIEINQFYPNSENNIHKFAEVINI